MSRIQKIQDPQPVNAGDDRINVIRMSNSAKRRSIEKLCDSMTAQAGSGGLKVREATLWPGGRRFNSPDCVGKSEKAGLAPPPLPARRCFWASGRQIGLPGMTVWNTPEKIMVTWSLCWCQISLIRNRFCCEEREKKEKATSCVWRLLGFFYIQHWESA